MPGWIAVRRTIRSAPSKARCVATVRSPGSPGPSPTTMIGPVIGSRFPRDLLFAAETEDRHERFLWNLDVADQLHPRLAFFLLFQQLALARHVAAVAFGEHVFPHRADRLA